MTETIECPIWETPAQLLAKGGDGVKVLSRRVDGEYRISGSAMETVRHTTASEKARLTTWVVDQHRSGERAPLITTETIERTAANRPLKWAERRQRFLLLASSRAFQPSDTFRIGGVNDAKYVQDTGAIAAWTECPALSHLSGIIRLLEEEGLLGGAAAGTIFLTAKGFEQMDALENTPVSSTQAFVAMWFDPSMDVPFDSGFAPAIADAGYRAFRIDRKEHGNKIDDEIIAEIRRSRFVVADFTCGIQLMDDKKVAIARGGVYYEAGFAQGLRIPVIWSCRSDCIDHVHFDTRQFNHIVWDNPSDLRTRLLNQIRAVIV